MRYADVAVDITAKALDRPFQYLIPPELEAEMENITDLTLDLFQRLFIKLLPSIRSLNKNLLLPT